MYPNGLHAIMDSKNIRWIDMAGIYEDAAGARNILDKLEEAYSAANRLDLVKVVKAWRQTVE